MLRRIICLNWPRPMLPVSPSPLTPIGSTERFASTAPVATDGMRPCSVLKPCERFKKYAGVLLEQPIPLILMISFGRSDRSYAAAMIWLVIELCPQPWHSVDSLPRYSCWVSPIRLALVGLPLAGLVSVVICISPLENSGVRSQESEYPTVRSDILASGFWLLTPSVVPVPQSTRPQTGR